MASHIDKVYPIRSLFLFRQFPLPENKASPSNNVHCCDMLLQRDSMNVLFNDCIQQVVGIYLFASRVSSNFPFHTYHLPR